MSSNSDKIGTVFFFLFLSFSLYLGYLIFEPFLKIIVFSILITIIFYPLFSKINSKIKKRTLSAVIITLIIIMFILIPGTLFIMFVTDQMISLYPTLANKISNIKDINYYIESIPLISDMYHKLLVGMESFNIKINLEETLRAIFNYVANFIISQGKSIFINFTLFVIGMIFVIITIFFLFRDGKRLYFFVYEVIPLSVKEKDILFTKFYNAIMGVVLGIVLTAIFQGILAGIGYYFAGIDYSFFWGFMTFLASFFPIGGTALVWVPIAIYAFFGKGLFTGIFLTLWGIFVISMIDNIVKPIIIGDRTSIHPMVLAFALLGGLNLFGFVGIFLAPIIVVFVENMLVLFKEKYLD